jgi:hypothetical protein
VCCTTMGTSDSKTPRTRKLESTTASSSAPNVASADGVIDALGVAPRVFGHALVGLHQRLVKRRNLHRAETLQRGLTTTLRAALMPRVNAARSSGADENSGSNRIGFLRTGRTQADRIARFGIENGRIDAESVTGRPFSRRIAEQLRNEMDLNIRQRR